VPEAVVWDAPRAGLREQPGVRHAEQPPGGCGVDQRRECGGVLLDGAAGAAPGAGPMLFVCVGCGVSW
jgi:hypothetical protein